MYEVSFSVVGDHSLRRVLVKALTEEEAKDAVRKVYEVSYMFWAVWMS
jgi:hypothetical protein